MSDSWRDAPVATEPAWKKAPVVAGQESWRAAPVASAVDFTAMAQDPSAQIPLSNGNPIQSKSLAGDIAGSFVTQAGQGIADLAGAPYAIASAAEAAGRDMKPGVPIRFIADPAFQPEAPRPTGPNFLQKLGAAGKEAFAGGNELTQATQGVFEPSGKHPIAAGVAGAVGGMIPAIATGNPLAAAGVIGAQSTGGSFVEYRNTLRKQGMADADAERLAGYGAVATGTLNGLSSVLPMSIVFRKAPGLRGMVARTIESAIAGGSQADLNLILTNAMKVSQGIDPKALENMTGQQLIDTFVTGGIVMGAFGALPHGIEPVKDRRTPRSQAYKTGQIPPAQASAPPSETPLKSNAEVKTPEQEGNNPTALGIGKPVGTEQQLEAMGAAGPSVSGPPARHSQILSGLLGAAKDTAHFVGDSLTGKSAPHTARASEESANRLVQYASSAIAAPHIAADFEAQILGDRVKDTEFSNKIGAVLTEDNLRSVRDEFAKTGDAEAADKVGSLIGSYFKDEAEYQAALKDPDVQAAAQRVKDILNPWMDQTFKITQNIPVEDELSSRGQTTGARINLKVLDPQAVQDQQMRVGGGSGNLQNPLKRKSRFGVKAKGTAQQYDVNLGEIIKNTVADRVEKTNRNLLYEQLKKDGLAIEAKPGERFADADGNSSSVAFIDGKPARKLEIKRAGGGPGMTSVTNLWIRPDVYGEVRKALAVDETFRNAGLARLGNILTHAQIAGPTDAVFHLSNIFSAITASPGGKTLLGELGRKIPGINLIDTTARLVTNALRVAKDSPEIRAELAEIAKIGALRGESQGKYTAKLIAIVDRAGRIAMNRMYDNLVERELADKGEAGRREFINQVGQYNERLHGRIMSMLKQVGASPFVVAGKTFNRLGLKQLVGGHGVKPISRLAGAQIRLTQAFGGAMTLIVVPALMNYLLHKNINGRPGTPFGAIDTGKDDSDGKHIVVDPAKWTGLRRGMRISGLDATINGVRTGQSGGRTRDTAIRDALNGFLHPYAGPLVNAAVTVGTGHAFSLGNKQDAPTVQPGKSQFAENAKTALANLNPTVRSIVDARKQGKSAAGSAGAAGFNLLGAAGIKSVSEPSATTKATNMISEIMRRNAPSDRTPDEIASSKLRHQLADKLRAGQDISSEARAAIQAGTITIKQLAETYKAAKQDPYTAMFKSLSLNDAQQVYDLGTPSEQAQWGRILSEKRLRDSVGNLEAKEKLKQKLTPIEQTTLRRNKNKLAEMERQDKARAKLPKR